eukprot:TRINITY_DN17725_c0_g1_i1.p1 TRINITY_DN17725_c0_g1~~TRINITY_DN17725_c0_g1_i1.p1  ORF type:complete len:168 (+),score=49.95 TRINITY_DN17725_c0_g1_i1:16-519(+)
MATAEPPRTLFMLEGVTLLVESENKGDGLLTVTNKEVVWTKGEERSALDFHHISLHAISRDPATGFPPCIYCQVDQGGESKEVRFAPNDPGMLDDLFNHFSQGAEMNPDPISEDEDESDAYFNMAEVSDGAALAHVQERMANCALAPEQDQDHPEEGDEDGDLEEDN